MCLQCHWRWSFWVRFLEIFKCFISNKINLWKVGLLSSKLKWEKNEKMRKEKLLWEVFKCHMKHGNADYRSFLLFDCSISAFYPRCQPQPLGCSPLSSQRDYPLKLSPVCWVVLPSFAYPPGKKLGLEFTLATAWPHVFCVAHLNICVSISLLLCFYTNMSHRISLKSHQSQSRVRRVKLFIHTWYKTGFVSDQGKQIHRKDSAVNP